MELDQDTCAGTRSGVRLSGMQFNDALLDIDREQDWRLVRSATACVIAELLGGYVTHIDEKSPDGFYFLGTDNTAVYIKFSDYLDLDLWLNKAWVQVSFNSQLVGGLYVVTCFVGDTRQESTHKDKYSNTAHILALIKGLLKHERSRKNV